MVKAPKSKSWQSSERIVSHRTPMVLTAYPGDHNYRWPERLKVPKWDLQSHMDKFLDCSIWSCSRQKHCIPAYRPASHPGAIKFVYVRSKYWPSGFQVCKIGLEKPAFGPAIARWHWARSAYSYFRGMGFSKVEKDSYLIRPYSYLTVCNIPLSKRRSLH